MNDTLRSQYDAARAKLSSVHRRISAILEEEDIVGAVILAEIVNLDHIELQDGSHADAKVATVSFLNIATTHTAYKDCIENRKIKLKEESDFNGDDSALKRSYATTSSLAQGLENQINVLTKFLHELCDEMPYHRTVVTNKELPKPE